MSAKLTLDAATKSANESQQSFFNANISTLFVAANQEELRKNAKADAEMPVYVDGFEDRLQYAGEGAENDLQLPVPLQNSEVNEDQDEKTELKNTTLIEIPDSDAPSPFTSPVKDSEVQILVDHGSEAFAAAVMKAEKEDNVMANETAGTVGDDEATMTGMVELAKEGNAGAVPTKSPPMSGLLAGAESGADARSEVANEDGSASLPIQKSVELQALMDGVSNILPHARDCITHQPLSMQKSTLAEQHVPAEKAQQAIRVLVPSAVVRTEEGSKDSLDFLIHRAAKPVSSFSDEIDLLFSDGLLPTENAPLPPRAGPEREALLLQEASNLPVAAINEVLSTKRTPRMEISASEDEDNTMSVDIDPFPGITEVSPSLESASKGSGTFFMHAESTKRLEPSVPGRSSTTRPESHTVEDAKPLSIMDRKLTSKSNTSTDPATTCQVAISSPELPQPEMTTKGSVVDSTDLDREQQSPLEGESSSWNEDPTSSVDLPNPSPLNLGIPLAAMDVELGHAPLSDTGIQQISCGPILGAKAGTFTTSTQPQETDKTQLREMHAEVAASSQPLEKQALQYSPRAAKTFQISSKSLLYDIEDDNQTELSSSSLKCKQGVTVTPERKATPSTSSNDPKIFRDDGGAKVKALKTLGKRKAASNPPIESQSPPDSRIAPKRTSDIPKASQAAADLSSNKSIVFAELKAMKIVCLVPSLSIKTISLPKSRLNLCFRLRSKPVTHHSKMTSRENGQR